MKTLSKNEIRFLRELRKMEKERVEFMHARIAKRLGYSSVGTTYDFLEQLKKKGCLANGVRLAMKECLVVTKAGQRALAKRAA